MVKTQSSITLSSAEAELVAMCKLAAEVIGIGSMAKDLGKDMKAVLHADSSAAIAISKRRGSGKLRHNNVGIYQVIGFDREKSDGVSCVQISPASLVSIFGSLNRGRLGKKAKDASQGTLHH